MVNRVARNAGLLSAWLTVAVGASAAPEGVDDRASTIRDGFETPRVAWRQEQTDAPIRIFAQERTRRAAHEGQFSEGFQFEAGLGGGLYYSYALPRIPVTEDLKVGLYVRSNRTGVQLLGRVVLPADVDPESGRPSFVLVPGTSYEGADRWQKIELVDLLDSAERQARVLRASTRRKVSLEGAYLERLVANIYGGEGPTEVYLDELTVGPVAREVAEAHARSARGEPARPGPSARTVADRPGGPGGPGESARPGANSGIKLDRNRLTRDGYPWFFTAVRAPGADPAQLRRVGVDVAIVPRGTDEAWTRAAVASGLLLVPELTGPDDRTMPGPDRLAAEAASYPWRDSVAFWSMGENLGRSTDLDTRKATLKRLRDAVLEIRKARPGGSPFTTGTVLGMLPEYARVPENLDLIGIPAADWATTHDALEAYQYLDQRRLLTARSNADALLWASLDASPPPIYRESIWGVDSPPPWGLPRVQPEQLRLATYSAIAAGCRGVCYRGDAELTRGSGRMNLIEMALLDEEIDLLEPVLGDPDKAIRMLDTYLPDPPPPPPITLFALNNSVTRRPPTPKEFPPNFTVKAAAITTKDRRGTLLMVADYSRYSQYQPPQAATNKLNLLVPGASDARAYLISPGGVQTLDSKREPGGHRIILDDFGVTAIVLLTTNVELKDQIERAVNANRPQVVNLAIEQAELQRAWVGEVDAQIQDLRHPQKDSQALLNQSAELIKSAREAQEREDYQTAWDEARRASRPLRVLMRYHFLAAYDAFIKALNDEDLPCGPIAYEGKEKPQPRIIPPTVAAPLASFNTLPQAWIWYEWIRTGRLGRNLIPSGNFNDPDVLKAGGWAEESYQTDDLKPRVQLKKEGGADKGGLDKKGSSVVLAVSPREGITIDSLPPFVDFPVVAVRSPAVKVGARQVYRISVMAYMVNQSAPGVGGLIVRDSIGGERLQFRTRDALSQDWFEIVYYRRAPADGTMSIMLGMAGYGYCSFDDLKVEPIVETIDPDQPVVVRPRRRPARPPEGATPTSDAGPTAPTRSAAGNRLRPTPIRE